MLVIDMVNSTAVIEVTVQMFLDLDWSKIRALMAKASSLQFAKYMSNLYTTESIFLSQSTVNLTCKKPARIRIHKVVNNLKFNKKPKLKF